MANVTITGLPPAQALTGMEILPIDQEGSTVHTTVQDVANLASGGGGATLDVVTQGTLGNSPFAVTFTYVAFLNPEGDSMQSAPVEGVPLISLGSGMQPFTGTLSLILFPTLTIGTFNFQSISTLTTIDLGPLETVYVPPFSSGGFTFSNCANLTTINIPSLVNIPNNFYMGWSSNAFLEITVDHILERMVATNATECQLYINGGTSAAPSATGLADKATLEGRGWIVVTN